jgi:hypothetical protein
LDQIEETSPSFLSSFGEIVFLLPQFSNSSGKLSNKKKREHIVDQIATKIASDPILSRIAAFAVKKEVDHIYGYSKYSIDEIGSELQERLYNPTYLGCSVGRILEATEVQEAVKIELAQNYLDIVASYDRGEMPKKTYEYWGEDAEPSCVIETAVFLTQAKKSLDWITKDKEYLKGVLSHTTDSSVESKKAMLEALVAKINEEHQQQQQEQNKLSTKRTKSITEFLSKEDIPAESWLSFLKDLNRIAPFSDEGKKKETDSEKGKFRLVSNLAALIDAKEDYSSAGALCRLSILGKDDLLEIFVDLPLIPFLRRNPSNRTMLYYDVAKVMVQERGVPFSSIVRGLHNKLHAELKKSNRVMYYQDEPKLKALCRLSMEISQVHNSDLLKLVHQVIKLKGVETETRFALFKFLYQNLKENQEKKSLLEEAPSFKSQKIKAWIDLESAKANRAEQTRGQTIVP